jgi:hypothetical protein
MAQSCRIGIEPVQGRHRVENIKHYRAAALLCRQQAVLHPEASWHWLAEAERYEELAEAEIEAHFKECNGGRIRCQSCGSLMCRCPVLLSVHA